MRDAAYEVDWNLFVRVTRRHRVQGFAWEELRRHGIEIPHGPAKAMAAGARAVAEQNLRGSTECKALLDSFSAAQVPLLFFKGLTTGALAYSTPLLKMSWDIDLLILPEDLSNAARLLNEAGFHPVIPAAAAAAPAFLRWHENRKESVWYKPDSDLFLELHTRVTGNPALLPVLTAKAASQDVEIAPGIQLPTFELHDLLLYLAVHGSSSAWFRLKWIADFVGLLGRADSPRPEEIYERSLQFRVDPAMAQALIISDGVFGIELTKALRTELMRNRLNRVLAGAAMRQLSNLREPGARPFGTVTNHVLQFFLMTGWRFKWLEILRQLSDARLNRSIVDAGTASARLKAQAKLPIAFH